MKRPLLRFSSVLFACIALSTACSDEGGDPAPVDGPSNGDACMGTTCDDQNACTIDSSSGDDCDAACEHVAIEQCISGDGCCPLGCAKSKDSDCEPSCGNGAIDPGEICDGNCPNCDDGVACTIDYTSGSSATCDRTCDHEAMTGCVSGDGCCPGGCNIATDADCSAACGNGVVDPGETCDQACPVYCADGNECTTDLMTGSPQTCNVACTFIPVTACVGGDGCCGAGCTSASDSDCPDGDGDACGNGQIDPGETCDPCDPATCNDQNACTVDAPIGAPAECVMTCVNQPIFVCGPAEGCCPPGCTVANDPDCAPAAEADCTNGGDDDGDLLVDCADPDCTGQACTDANACTFGDTCQAGQCLGAPGQGQPCDDENACTQGDLCVAGVCQGTPVLCVHPPGCQVGICDPTTGCSFTNVPDGAPCAGGTCQNGQCVSSCTPGVELCNSVDDDCDGSIDEDAVGVGVPCDGPDTDLCQEGVTVCALGTVICSDVTPDSGESCNGFDDDCDGTIDEVCAVCGNGVVDVFAGEQCDDGNTASGDGCSATCTAEICGNGVVDAGEACDDGNVLPGDGCSPTCTIETCGNGACDGPETTVTCPIDCPMACGDGVCDPGELFVCLIDCPPLP